MSINVPETMTAETWAAEFAAYMMTTPAEELDVLTWFRHALSYAYDEGYSDGVFQGDAEASYAEGYTQGQNDAKKKIFV